MPYADSAEVLLSIPKVYIEGISYDILSARSGDGVYYLLKGISDRTAAERLRGNDVYADKQDVKIDEGRWFVSDIISSKITFDTGDFTAVVTDVTRRGSTDIFTARLPSGKNVSFPFLKDMIISVDTENKVIVLKKKRFDEVSLYED